MSECWDCDVYTNGRSKFTKYHTLLNKIPIIRLPCYTSKTFLHNVVQYGKVNTVIPINMYTYMLNNCKRYLNNDK